MPRIVSLLCLFVVLLPARALAAGDPYGELQWGLARVEGRRAWQVADGSGTIVAVIDSGVDRQHPDLAQRLVAGRDFVDDDDEPWDENGHGTLIAGIIAANTGNGEGIAGTAPGAQIMPVRVLDERGTGSSKDVAEGIEWAVAHGADVVNLSLAQDAGRGVLGNLLADPAVDDAITEAARSGATVVIAAGNDPKGGRAETAYDATTLGAVVVGATTDRDKRAAYANHGDGLDLVAPGGGSATDPSDKACSEDNGIVSTWWNPDTGRSSYGAGCGTSMAVAFVSGVAAMLHELGLTNAQAVERMVGTVDDLGESGPDAATGAGRINAARAVGAPKAKPSHSPASSAARSVTTTGTTRSGQAQPPPARSAPAPTVRPATAPAPKTSATQMARPKDEAPFAAGRIPAQDRPYDRGALLAFAGAALIALIASHLVFRVGRRRRAVR